MPAAREGFNVTVFAYGHTGTGKSYTMLGEEGASGIVPRMLPRLFGAPGGDDKYFFAMSYYEVYMEQLRDLLGPGCTSVNSAGAAIYGTSS